MSKSTDSSISALKTTFTAYAQPEPGDEWMQVTIIAYADTVGEVDINDVVYASGKAIWLNSRLQVIKNKYIYIYRNFLSFNKLKPYFPYLSLPSL